MQAKPLLRRMFGRTLEALDVTAAVRGAVRCDGSNLYAGGWHAELRAGEVRVIAVGKAAHAMLDGLCARIPATIRARGIVACPTMPPAARDAFEYYVAGHPAPNQESLNAGRAALALAREAAESPLVVLLSGGGSALMEAPLLPGLSLEDLQAFYRALVTCGASIVEINAVRKHTSAVKGGRLAQAAAPAPVLTLAVTDVPAGQESALASGPTLPDPTRGSDVAEIVAKYRLAEKFPRALADWLAHGDVPETPKPGDAAFARAQFCCVLGLHELFHNAHRVAQSEDCEAFCDNTTDDWPVEKAAEYLLGQLEELRVANPGKHVALIADGELSSAVTGSGLGGRNAAFVLACARRIAGRKIAVLSCGTDGIDGNSPAAGAVADGETLARAEAAGMDSGDYFRRSDAYSFFAALDDAVVTGPTGNNLRDLRILLAWP